MKAIQRRPSGRGGLESKVKNISPGLELVPTIFIGKWTVKVMYFLKKGPQRHGQLRRGLGNVSQRMLTRALRNLESPGLIARQVTRTKSLVVEYSLTKLGRTFIVPLDSICRWAAGNKKELSAVVRLRDKQR
jgi:DNA-binding HxlR family transcriptional regulator